MSKKKKGQIMHYFILGLTQNRGAWFIYGPEPLRYCLTACVSYAIRCITSVDRFYKTV